MNSAEFQTINKPMRKHSEEKPASRPGSAVSKNEYKRSGTFVNDSDGKYCMVNSKIPRRQAPAPYWLKETLKNHQGKSKSKKPPSMIPRSNSRKRPQTEESIKNTKIDSCEFFKEKKILDTELEEVSFSSVKSFHTLKEDESDSIYKDAEDDILSCFRGSRPELRKDRGSLLYGESDKQDKAIQNLYNSIKCVVGPMIDKIKLTDSEKNNLAEIIQVHSTTTQVIEGSENGLERIPDFTTIQGHYEFTMKEISNIWKNAISLIGSVKDHTVKFMEENDKAIDKEQLILESEMLQLAIDFAISYSKLKTDFLIKTAKKHFGLKGLEKTEVESFMDSKMFSSLYNNDDLAAMARTVQDLNVSVVKGEDFELE